MLVLSRRDVRDLLDVDALIDALADAMVDLSLGRASVPQRNGAFVDERGGMLAAMPGYTPSAGALASKLVTLFPQNAGSSLPTHQAVIAVFDPANGQPTALLDGTEITAVRTACGSALATRLLAREDATTLAILGTGVQARAHARAVARVRSFAELRVAGRDPEKVAALADELGARATTSWEEACDGADVVCATTHSPDPVVRREWLHDGAHVTSVGFNPAGRELDDATVADALVVIEARASTLAPPPSGSNDLIDPIARGVISADDVAEIGEVIARERPGRTSPDQITLYKSVGVAVQDGVAARLVLDAARERGVGRTVEL
jgi:ornithine cyclodeaminase